MRQAALRSLPASGQGSNPGPVVNTQPVASLKISASWTGSEACD